MTEINKGDLAFFPKEFKCCWDVIERIRKVYLCPLGYRF